VLRSVSPSLLSMTTAEIVDTNAGNRSAILRRRPLIDYDGIHNSRPMDPRCAPGREFGLRTIQVSYCFYFNPCEGESGSAIMEWRPLRLIR
jgi:hypothetical protein